ncbi:head-tail adaptor protein [Shimia sp.]|uniref:head-tail adaptor protein n=1 Tax=Shimia sp. TaxID=1954381 RepID=UPI003B8C0C42
MRAGDLRDKVAFDKEVVTPDGSGGHDRNWEQHHACRAQFIYSRGSETVDAARLQGRSIYKVKIRSCAVARAITTDFRMRDVRRGDQTAQLAGEPYQIREVDSITDRRWIYIVVESGVAE